MYPRLVNILKQQSFFLFGARATGKSYLLQHLFAGAPTIWIDLLDDEQFITLTKFPKRIEQRVSEYLH